MNAYTHAARGLRGNDGTIALRTRFVVLAVGLAVVAARANGASYVLANTPPAANELVFACSVIHHVKDIVETPHDASSAHPLPGRVQPL